MNVNVLPRLYVSGSEADYVPIAIDALTGVDPAY
jgi:hypothetical protein